METFWQDLRYGVRAGPDAGIHTRGDSDARSRHWRECGDFQRHARGPALTAAVCRHFSPGGRPPQVAQRPPRAARRPPLAPAVPVAASKLSCPVPVFVLSIHADYACRHSGACCTAAWRIPVEPACEDRLLLSSLGRTRDSCRLLERDDLTVMALAEDGACVAFERGAGRAPSCCAVHRVLGHDALPSACQHFPRAAVTDDLGTFVTLSHFCPTAAGMLFRDDVELSIVEASASFGSATEYEGFDARGALPPLLAPGMLMDLEGHHAWERHVVRLLADRRHTPELALERLQAQAAQLCSWRPVDGPLRACIESLGEATSNGAVNHGSERSAPTGCGLGAAVERGGHEQASAELARLYEMVRASVPLGLEPEPLPGDFADTDAELVAPAWRSFAVPISRYLAAKAFASWISWQALGVVTAVAALWAARAVLRVEAGRQCRAAGRILDGALLVQAIRQADLLLVHKASSQALADRLVAMEQGR
jgi:Fe-S-cluster containining protein